jgi:hypothetical protein
VPEKKVIKKESPKASLSDEQFIIDTPNGINIKIEIIIKIIPIILMTVLKFM